MAERLARDEGIAIGHSGGAGVEGARRVAAELCAAGRRGVVVTVLPDHASRYFQTRPRGRTPAGQKRG